MIEEIVEKLLAAKLRFSVRCATRAGARNLSCEVRDKLEKHGAPWRWNSRTGRIDLTHPDGPAVNFLPPDAPVPEGHPVLLCEQGVEPAASEVPQDPEALFAYLDGLANKAGFAIDDLRLRIIKRKARAPHCEVHMRSAFADLAGKGQT